jgi:hypothetical protein
MSVLVTVVGFTQLYIIIIYIVLLSCWSEARSVYSSAIEALIDWVQSSLIFWSPFFLSWILWLVGDFWKRGECCWGLVSNCGRHSEEYWGVVGCLHKRGPTWWPIKWLLKVTHFPSSPNTNSNFEFDVGRCIWSGDIAFVPEIEEISSFDSHFPTLDIGCKPHIVLR